MSGRFRQRRVAGTQFELDEYVYSSVADCHGNCSLNGLESRLMSDPHQFFVLKSV